MERERLVVSRQAPLLALVPYAAIRQFEAHILLALFVTERWLNFGQAPNQQIFEAGTPKQPCLFLYTELDWDTKYFGFKAIRLQAVLFGTETGVSTLVKAVLEFNDALRMAGAHHCYVEVAVVDPQLLYALGQAGWSLVETRLHYHRCDLLHLTEPRYSVRPAGLDESEIVRQVSYTNANAFDRFHADPVFTTEQADTFLGEYAAASVRGLTDIVLVPEKPTPLDSFLAVSYLNEDAKLLDIRLGRVVLTAVGAQNRGWHRKLVSETLWHTHERGGEVVLMTTQATNRAVVRNCEALGFALGSATHICSKVF